MCGKFHNMREVATSVRSTIGGDSQIGGIIFKRRVVAYYISHNIYCGNWKISIG
jgi:hypothetical protein